MIRFICFDVIENRDTPSLESLMGISLGFFGDDYTPTNPKFCGWEIVAIEWCKSQYGDYAFTAEPVQVGDTYGCISYDDGFSCPDRPDYEDDPDF